MPSLQDIRAQYPQYGDMSDKQLADALYGKFYSDMPREKFDAAVGLQSAPRPAPTVQQVSAAIDSMVSTATGLSNGIQAAAVRAPKPEKNFIERTVDALGGAGAVQSVGPMGVQQSAQVAHTLSDPAQRRAFIEATPAGLRAGARSLAPTSAAVYGAGAGSTTGATWGSRFGQTGAAIGGFGGGLLGALAGGYIAGEAQNVFTDALPTGVTAPIGMDRATREADERDHPIATMIGSNLPGFAFGVPGGGQRLPAEAGLVARVLEHPVAQPVIGAGINTAIEGGRQIVSGNFDPTALGVAAVTGALQTKNTRLGERTVNAGAATATRGMAILDGIKAARAQAALAQDPGVFQPAPGTAASEGAPNGAVEAPQPRVAPVGPAVEPVAGAPISATGLTEMGKGLSGGMGGSLRAHLLAKVNAGEILENGQESAILQVAKMVKDAGVPVDADMLSRIQQGIDAARNSEDYQGGMRALVSDIVNGGTGVTKTVTPAEGEKYVTSPAGRKVGVKFEVVDARQLKHAEGELQNRDRSRDTTDLQVQDIVSRFDPTRLGDSAEGDRGAPIVGPDDVVESGNGRMMAINRVYDAHPEKAQAYRDFIEGQGYDTAGIERPVLIRRRTTEMTPEDRRAWVVENNKDAKLELSPSERARSDADSITPEMLAKYNGGDLNSTANRSFVEDFNKRLTAGEMGNMIGDDRRLTTAGQQRIENAVVAHAYGEPKLLEKMMESSHNEIRSITGSMADVAGEWGRLRAAARDGEIDDKYDITPDLVAAARRVADARQTGMKPADILAQADAFDPVSPVEAELIRAFHNDAMTRAASRKAVTEILRDYVRAASEAKATPDMFGEVHSPEPADILKQVLSDRAGAGQESMFTNKTVLHDTADKERRRIGKEPSLRPAMRWKERTYRGRFNETHEDLIDRHISENDRNDALWDVNAKGYINERGKYLDRFQAAEYAKNFALIDRGSDRFQQWMANAPELSSDIPLKAQKKGIDYDTQGEARGDQGRRESQPEEARKGGEVREGRVLEDAGSRSEGGRGEGASSAGLRSAEGAGVRQGLEDRSGITSEDKGGYRDTFHEASFTNRPSVYEGAIRATGIEPDKFRLLPPERQLNLLQRAFRDLTGIETKVDPGMNLRPAIDQLLDAHQTLQGMAHVLGITPAALSLGGKLQLKLLKKGKFLGVFYPGENAIGLPGRSNSFAHEWSHALDYHLLSELAPGDDGKGMSGMIRRDGADFAPQTVKDAFVDLLNAMFFDKAKMAHKIMDLEARIAKTKSEKQKVALQAQIDRFRSGNSQARDVRSQYYRDAQTLEGSDYWTSPTEMMARAMEAYVSAKAQAEGFGTEFIGKGDTNYLSDAEERFAKTFPKDAERERIFEAIHSLMTQLHNEAIVEAHGGSKPVLGDIVKASDFDRYVPLIENGNLIQREITAIQRDLKQRALAKEGRANNPKTMGQTLHDVVATIAYSMSAKMKIYEKRWNSSAIKEVHDKLAYVPGKGEYTGWTFHEDSHRWTRLNLNRVANVLKATDLIHRDDAKTMRQLRDALIGEGVDGLPDNVVKAAAGIRRILDEEYYRNTKAGIDLGYARGVGYLKRMLDLPRVHNDPAGFLNDAGEVYKVTFDKQYGEPDDLLSQDDGLSTFMQMAKQFGVDGLDELRKMAKEMSRLNAAMKKSDDPDMVQGKIDELSSKISEHVGEMWDAVRDAFGARAAEAWLAKINMSADYDAHSPDNSYTKSRELPPEADKLLEKFYYQDPIEAVTAYIHQSARRVAYAERFGVNGEKLEALVERMAAEGVPVSDQNDIRKIVAMATGRVGSTLGRSEAQVMSMIQAYGTMRLLPRAVLSSLAEPITAALAAGNVNTGFKTLAATISGAGTVKGAQRHELARAMGIVNDIGVDMNHEARFGGKFGDDLKGDWVVQRMFRNTGLTGLTRRQQTHTLAGSHAFLDNLAGKAVKGDIHAAAMLKELGVSDPVVFSKELLAKGRMPTVDELATKWGDEYALASTRFNRMTIMEPSPMERSLLAQSGPVARIIFAITSFSSSFWRNVMKRQLIMAGETYKREAAQGNKAAGVAKASKNVALGFLPAALSLYVMQGIVSTLREYLLNRERWDEDKQNGTLDKRLAGTAFTRAFSFGLADNAIQAYTGLKYQRDLAYIFIGAAPGSVAQDLQNIIMPTVRNNDKNNIAEYNRAKAAYNMAIGPAVATALSFVPGGPVINSMSGIGQMVATSPAAGSAAATALEGPKGSKTNADGEIIGPPTVRGKGRGGRSGRSSGR